MILTLRRTEKSGPLVPATFQQALGLMAKLTQTPQGGMRGQELRLKLKLTLDDDASFGTVLDFAGQGARVTTSTHGRSEALVRWAMHSLGPTLKADLVEDEEAKSATPEVHRGEAIAYLEDYEQEIRTSRKEMREPKSEDLIAWLAREEYVLLAATDTAMSFADLPLNDVPELYEQLLDHASIDDVFVSERELSRLLTRFKARFTLTR